MALQGEFGSISAADATYGQFVSQGGDDSGGNDGGGTDTGNLPKSDLWSGSVSGPDEVANGQSFEASARVRNTSSSQASSRFVLAFYDGNSPTALASSSTSVSAGSSQQLSFTTTGGWNLSPGDYALILFATGDGKGLVAKSTMTVTSASGKDGDKGEWGQVSIVRELKYGWYLAKQTHKTKDKVRFMVVGKKDGKRLYLYPGGKVRVGDPHFFSDVGSAAEAYKAWIRRKKNGNTDDSKSPSPSAGRPSPQKIKQDARQKSASGISGFVSENPLLAGGAGVLLAWAAYSYYKYGELRLPKQLKQLLNSGGGS